METLTILRASAWLLGAAAGIGAVMAVLRYAKDRPAPVQLSRLHGLLAATGLGLLVYGWASPSGLPKLASTALALLVTTGASGLIMTRALRWWRPAAPVELVLFGHMMLASTGLILLVAAVRSAPG